MCLISVCGGIQDSRAVPDISIPGDCVLQRRCDVSLRGLLHLADKISRDCRVCDRKRIIQCFAGKGVIGRCQRVARE